MKNLPNHVAIIMDGNTRWAENQNLDKSKGHKEGVKKARLAVEFFLEKEIDNLTLFAFDKGQALSGHSSPMDAYVQILSGEMNITIAETTKPLKQGELILMPAGIDHALEALEPTKMLLTMVSV